MGLNTGSRQVLFAVILVGIFVTRRHAIATNNENTLELLQVLVRHGNRTSGGVFTQFMSQYIETFHPFEFGQLTPRGRRQMANVGNFLRQRYANFLPAEFSYDSVSVKCSAVIRVLESAMVAMAAMFPPKDRQQWQDNGLGAEWTPIPCQYVPAALDTVLAPSSVNCPRFIKMLVDVHSEPAYLSRYSELTANGSVIEYIQRSLDMSTSEPLSEQNLQNVWEMLHLLDSSEFPLPEWSKAVYPSPLTEINHLGLWSFYGSPERIMFSVGEYLREIISIADAIQKRELRPLTRKMFISFAHDQNVMPLLVAFNLETNPLQTDYGGIFIMEMHRIRETDEIGFKFVYRNVTWQDPTIYTMPGCQQICPLSFVKKTVEQYIPTVPFDQLCSLDQDGH